MSTTISEYVNIKKENLSSTFDLTAYATMAQESVSQYQYGNLGVRLKAIGLSKPVQIWSGDSYFESSLAYFRVASHPLKLLYYVSMVRKPKYQQVFDTIEEGILSGRYEPGQKLPSEANLVDEYGTSRITVVRALRELQQRGLVQRRAG